MGVGLPWELGESCRCEGVAMRIRNISLRVVSLLVLTFVFVVATSDGIPLFVGTVQSV